MTQVLLSSLLQGISETISVAEIEITGLSLDSRTTQSGDLFFACVGSVQDGRRFIPDAIKKGARAVLAEKSSADFGTTPVPVIAIENLQQHLGLIAARFFSEPSKKMRMIGVTGTNGKTSTCHFIAASLQQLGETCGVLGTLGNGLYGNLQTSSLTTLDAISLQKTLAELLLQGATTIAMEVSSHSLDQGRVNGIDFRVGVFTNLTRDHLDYHGSMENYGLAKRRLFEKEHLQVAVLNADDAFGRSLIETCQGSQEVFVYSLQKNLSLSPNVALIFAEDIKLDLTGIHARVRTPWGQGELHSRLVGQFNLSNLLAVLTTLCAGGIPLEAALSCLQKLQPVSGRMQTFGGGEQPLVVVDYAHTPDALKQALIALRVHVNGKLWCLFGCGGERDVGKRPEMARVAEQYADQVVVSDDNPRREDPEKIVKDIVSGFQHPSKALVRHGRAAAIQEIIQAAKAGDCILIAGKGAETYQQIGEEKIPYSDIELVKACLKDSLS